MLKYVRRDYDNEFANSGATTDGKRGPTLRIRKPNRFTVSKQAALAVQDLTEEYVTIGPSTQYQVSFRFSGADEATTIDDIAERYVRPACLGIASTIDSDCAALYKDVYNIVGVAGTEPGAGAALSGAEAPAVYLNAGATLSDDACPFEQRTCVINPRAQAASVGGLAGLFNPQTVIADQYKRGEIGDALGFTFAMDQNINRHLTGTRAASGQFTVSGGSQTGSSLLVVQSSGGTLTLKAGDVFYIASGTAVNHVNWETHVSNGIAQRFVVTADASCATATPTSISISPSITLTGPTQTVTASPDSGAAMTFYGAASTYYSQNLAFHRDAFCFVTADLVMPDDVAWKARDVYEGVSMRVMKFYDGQNDNNIFRIDVLGSAKTLYPQLGCRILGA
jgi:hypothetical protein